MFLKQTIRIIAFFLLFFAGASSHVFATQDPVQTNPLLGSKDSVKVNYISVVADYQQLLRNVTPSLQPAIESGSTHIVNRVSVGIEEDSKTYIRTDFTATIVLHVKKYDLAMTTVIDEFDSSFTVNYLKAEGAKYTSLKYIVFENSYKTEVKIVSIDPHGTTSWDISKVLRVDNTLQASRDYAFDCNILPGSLSVALDAINGELKASWADPNNGQTEYDLEWAWVAEDGDDNYKTGGNWDQDLLFNANSSRVTTSGNSYNIPLLYDGKGKLFVRVRTAQIRLSGQRVEGHWAWQNSGSPVSYAFDGHEPLLNWQSSTSFAEEGKRKTVIQYFDGSLRSRQTVTKDNTTGDIASGKNGTTVVAETFYDYQGRPVIQVLPAPTLNSIISYTKNFNKGINYTGYPKWAYDLQDANGNICGSMGTGMDNSTGASQYYSPSNPMLTGAAANDPIRYVADAQHYPFTETRFTPDGRVASQGGVGPTHQLGNNHETKYVYEPPAQEELDALFGTDAGKASHYFKSIVKDANHQYSINYTDMHGRTVATALAGNAPPGTDPIAGNNQRNFTKQLLDEETNRVVDNTKSIVSIKALASLSDQWYTFHYKLDPEQLKILDCHNAQVCYDCIYDLKITVTSDCNLAGFPIEKTYDNFSINSLNPLYDPSCTGNGISHGTFDQSFQAFLPEGGYTVTKVLTLSKKAQDYYRDIFMQKNTCKTMQDFYQAELNGIVAQSNCNMTCATCTTAVGTFEQFRARFLTEAGISGTVTPETESQILTAYHQSMANCDRLCANPNGDGMEQIRSIKNLMLSDVSPGGQYAVTDGSGTYNIFSGTTTAPAFGEPGPGYTHPLIYTWNNPASLEHGSFKDVNGIHVQAQYAGPPNIDDFSNQFESSWAEQLLPFHPEYRKLKFAMEKLPATYQFEANLNGMTTWNNMINATGIPGEYLYSDPNDFLGIITADPFFTNTVLGSNTIVNNYRNRIKAKVNSYIDDLVTGPTTACPDIQANHYGPVTMWQIAQAMVFCRTNDLNPCLSTTTTECFLSTPPIPDAYPSSGCATDWDRVWINFRTMYLSERNKLVTEFLDNKQVKANILQTQGYTPRFINSSLNNGIPAGTATGDLQSIFNDILDPSGPNSGAAQSTAQGIAFGQDICQSHVNTWMSQLAACPDIASRWTNAATKTADQAWLIPKLLGICAAGTDQTHMLGSSSVKPGDPAVNGFYNFTEVVAEFMNTFVTPHIPNPTAVCNKYLITVPKPYDKQQTLVNSGVMTTPTDCECTQLENLMTEYNHSNFTGNFSQYLSEFYHTAITQGALDTLYSLCHHTYSCIFLPKPIQIPPVLQCHDDIPAGSYKPCISCDDYANFKHNFETEFGFSAPVENPQTQEDVDKNLAFQTYMNTVTGFTKPWTEYLAFQHTCANQPLPCESLNAALAEFYATTAYQQHPNGEDCRTAFVNFFNNYFGLVKTYNQWMQEFLSACGTFPDPCAYHTDCPTIESYINQFYDTYGFNVYTNANCQQLFVAFMNNKTGQNMTYDDIEHLYQITCHVHCSLDICTFPNCFLLTRMYNDFMTYTGGHPWTLPNCQDAFVDYFNNYFGLVNEDAVDWSKIQEYYSQCGENGCAPDISHLCSPELSCPTLEYIVQLFHQQYPNPGSTDECHALFMQFYNSMMGANYTEWDALVKLYYEYCGTPPDVCNGVTVPCEDLLVFLNSYDPQGEADGLTCEEMFVQSFNEHFGTSYQWYIDIFNLYANCGYGLKICGDPHPGRTCENLQICLNDFLALYPDPESELGGDCQNVFRSFFNNYFGTTGGYLGGWSYTQILKAYHDCNIELNICDGGAAEAGRSAFVSHFVSRFSSLQVPQAVRRDLFTKLYNEEFINSKSARAAKRTLVMDAETSTMSTTKAATDETSSKAIKEVVNFEEIAALLTVTERAAINNAPVTMNSYNPAVLQSMKQVYYVLHPRGLPEACSEDFSSWFNVFMSTHLTYRELQARYNSVCGEGSGNICGNETADAAIDLSEIDLRGVVAPVNSAPPMLCGQTDPVFPPYHPVPDPCSQIDSVAWNTAEIKWELYKDSLKNVFDLAYNAKCMSVKNIESLTANYYTNEYQYTLYYYDQAGNLVRTVPPAGVSAQHTNTTFLTNVKNARAAVLNGAAESSNVVVPAHTLYTDYRYNALNQVIEQKTPDAGKSNFYYDRLGRLVVSQNAKQATANNYSYTMYDELGRITEVGQLNTADALPTTHTGLTAFIQNKPAEQITRTVYDKSYFGGNGTLCPDEMCQQNLRNRVSYSAVYETGTTGVAVAGTHSSATFYSYDIHGNVDQLLQDFNGGLMKYRDPSLTGAALEAPANLTGSRFKKIVYSYDLISGKVNEVVYQPGKKDAFYHRYSYDAENRITDVETSIDNVIWDKDARYVYYKHGPLARAVLGQNQVQGVDYAYNLQGWLKGVNSTSVNDGSKDIGNDGIVSGGILNQVARDAYGFSLNYFTSDYTSISGVVPFTGNTFTLTNTDPTAPANITAKPLYNGNIASMFVNIPKIGDGQLYAYKYDQLNRITGMDMFKGFDNVNNNWTSNPVASADYKERISYDANGNIQTYLRNGDAARNSMDDMKYWYYYYDAGNVRQQYNLAHPAPANALRITNQLAKVDDQAADAAAGQYDNYKDIKQSQANGNYSYDEIGNLISDASEGISNIQWNVYGKIKSITKNTGTIEYAYDASGNRISKAFNGKTTYYTRDATGNVMSIYEAGNAVVNSGHLSQTEIDVYGSSRLAVYNVTLDMTTAAVTGSTVFERGHKFFELSNHLGNVMATVSDRSIPHSTNGTTIDWYNPEVVTANDYYPFGMAMPGRKYVGTGGYRYGFNGKENDKEVKGEANQQNFGMRIYDPRLGRFLSVEPFAKSFPSETSYSLAGNNPISNLDIEGAFKLSKATATFLKNKYPKFYSYITSKEGISKMSNNLKALLLYNEMGRKPSDLKNDFTYGQGAEIRIVGAHGVLGQTPAAYSGEVIEIDSKLLDILENAKSDEDIDAGLLSVVDVIMHEYGHRISFLIGLKELGDKYDNPNNFTHNEDGIWFSDHFFGTGKGYSEFNKTGPYNSNFNSIRLNGAKIMVQDLKNNGKSDILPKMPGKKQDVQNAMDDPKDIKGATQADPTVA